MSTAASRSAPHPTDDAPSHARQYAAFISYRHADNRQEGRQWASWLHHSLETYEVPADLVGTKNERGEPIPARIFPVFRDEEEFPVDADLSASIVRALAASRYLVVLCSPGATGSRFVSEEIARFKAMGKGDRVVAAIVSGEPNATGRAGHDADQECFPAPLRFEVEADGSLSTHPAEPLAADFRLEDGGEGWTSPEAYRQALEAAGTPRGEAARRVEALARRLETMKLKVIAGILEVPLGVLTQRDRAYQLLQARRRARTLRRWLAAVGMLALLAAGGGFWALRMQVVAQAKQKEVVATLAASDWQRGAPLLEDDETAAEGMAMLARSVRDGGHRAASIRLWTLLQQRELWIPVQGGASPAVASGAPPLVPPEVRRRFSSVDWEGTAYAPKFVEVSEDGSTVVTVIGHAHLEDMQPSIRVWNVNGGALTPWLDLTQSYEGGRHLVEARAAHLSPDGGLVAVVARPYEEPEYVEIRDVRSRRRIGEHVHATGRSAWYEASFSKVRWAGRARQDGWCGEASTPEGEGDGRDLLLLTASQKGDASIHAVSPRSGSRCTIAEVRHRTAVTAIDVDTAQEWLMSASADGDVRVTDLRIGEAVGNVIQVEGSVQELRRAGARRLRMIFADGKSQEFELLAPLRTAHTGVRVRREEDDCVQADPEAARTERPVPIGKGVAGKHLAWLGDRQLAVLQDGGESGRRSPVFGAGLLVACLSRSGRRVMVTNREFVSEIWNSDFSARLGRPLAEQRLIGDDDTKSTRPNAAVSVALSPKEDNALTLSIFWDPPNASQWATAWDVETGLPLTDRGIGEDGNDAVFDSTGRYIALVTGIDSSLRVVDVLQLRPPDAALAWLPDLAEALGGVMLDARGNSVPVTHRAERLARWLPRLAQYRRGSGSDSPSEPDR